MAYLVAEEEARRQERRRVGAPEPVPLPEYLCPISQEVMVDPVTTSDGFTYDRANIERWLREHDTSPVTNQRVGNKTLVPNTSLRILIAEWPQREHARLMQIAHAQHTATAQPQPEVAVGKRKAPVDDDANPDGKRPAPTSSAAGGTAACSDQPTAADTFAAIDTDGDGVITQAELAAALARGDLQATAREKREH